MLPAFALSGMSAGSTRLSPAAIRIFAWSSGLHKSAKSRVQTRILLIERSVPQVFESWDALELCLRKLRENVGRHASPENKERVVSATISSTTILAAQEW